MSEETFTARSKEYLDLLSRLLTAYAWIATSVVVTIMVWRIESEVIGVAALKMIATTVAALSSIAAAVAIFAMCLNHIRNAPLQTFWAFVAIWAFGPAGLVIFAVPAVIYTALQAVLALS